MIFELCSDNMIVHCKVIVSQIISYDVFINGCSLIFLYDVSSNPLSIKAPHRFNNLIGIKIVDLVQCDSESIKYIGSESVNKWEADMDIGIRSINQGKWISSHEIGCLEHDHEILDLGDKILAIPFYDMENKQSDHIPLFQIEEGVTTIRGLLREIS